MLTIEFEADNWSMPEFGVLDSIGLVVGKFKWWINDLGEKKFDGEYRMDFLGGSRLRHLALRFLKENMYMDIGTFFKMAI